MTKAQLSRRSFVKTTGALGALACAGGVCGVAAFEASEQAHAEATETTAWSMCNVNCGGNCVFQWHVKDGKVAYMETDNTGTDDFQARACLRGRSMRR